MIGLIRTKGSLTFYSFDMDVNVDGGTGFMRRNDNTKLSVLASSVFSQVEATKDFVYMACPTCRENLGMIYIIEPKTMKSATGVLGKSGYGKIGQKLFVTYNADDTNQVWFSSMSGTTINLNSIVAFQDFETEQWGFNTEWDQFGFQGTSETDTLWFGCYEQDCFYKSNLGSEIGTFKSCDFNQKLETNYQLDGRKCKDCSFARPFSYGYAE